MKGKKQAQATNRRAAVAEDALAEARAMREAAATSLADQEARHRAEIHSLRMEHAADLEARVAARFAGKVEVAAKDAAEVIWAKRERELRIDTAKIVSQWMKSSGVKASMSAYASLADALALGRDAHHLLDAVPRGNRHARRTGVTKIKMLAALDE